MRDSRILRTRLPRSAVLGGGGGVSKGDGPGENTFETAGSKPALRGDSKRGRAG